MALVYYRRFTNAQKRIATKSDALKPIQISQTNNYFEVLNELNCQLDLGNVAYVERASQELIDEICRPLKNGNMRVSSARVHVLERRPHDNSGELYGLYEPIDQGRLRARLYVWMKTAKRQQVVAFKTYLRTLVHELCHHLDYEYYGLEDSLHTQGFFRRESAIVKQLINCMQ